MPRVRWGIDSSDVDDFDRESQFKPYAGPLPPLGVYEWQVKVVKYVAGTKDKNPQLRVGLALAPRENVKGEKKYAGYFLLAFLIISNKTTFQYVPFLDAIGVSGREFAERTIVDEDGKVSKIGRWRNDGESYVNASIVEKPDQDGIVKRQVGQIFAIEESDDDDFEGEDEESDIDADDEDEEEEEEPF